MEGAEYSLLEKIKTEFKTIRYQYEAQKIPFGPRFLWAEPLQMNLRASNRLTEEERKVWDKVIDELITRGYFVIRNEVGLGSGLELTNLGYNEFLSN